MGKVVNIDASSKRRKAGSRERPSKTALVLGGGGFTGGVYEIGALRALDLLAGACRRCEPRGRLHQP